jgi:hypothetical protein
MLMADVGKMAASTVEKVDAPRFCCGIDIGVKNLAISFVEYIPIGTKREPLVASYKGTMELMRRFVEGMEVESLSLAGGRGLNHDSYIEIFEAIPEFANTISTVIEMQVVMNKSDMSRLDGVAYGFLRGRFPSMDVNLNGSTIRKKFTTEGIAQSAVNPDEVIIPRGYPTSKHQSFLFVGCTFPSHYIFLQSLQELDKLDDVCDSLVYASIALSNYTIARMLEGRTRK